MATFKKKAATQKIPHYGNVVLEDDVEVGALCHNRPWFSGLGHALELARRSTIRSWWHTTANSDHITFLSRKSALPALSQRVLTSSALVKSELADHVHLSDGAVVGAKAGVHKDLAGGETYLGCHLPFLNRKPIRQVMAARKLPEMRSQLKKMEKQLQALQQRLDNDQSQKPAA